jgi:hypothetical protein
VREGDDNSIAGAATVSDRGTSGLSLHDVSRQPNSARRDKLSGGRHCRRPDKGRRRLARERCLRQANKRERVLRDLPDLEEGRRRELHSRRRAGRRPGTISACAAATPVDSAGVPATHPSRSRRRQRIDAHGPQRRHEAAASAIISVNGPEYSAAVSVALRHLVRFTRMRAASSRRATSIGQRP